MSQLPFMRMFWGDFFGKVGHLSGFEQAIYAVLLGRLWLAGGTLPDDDRLLCRLLAIKLATWQRLKPALLPFLTVCDGRLTQKRLTEEFLRAREEHQKQTLRTTRAREELAKSRKPKGSGRANGSVTATVTTIQPEPEKKELSVTNRESSFFKPQTPQEERSVAQDLGITPSRSPVAPTPQSPKPAPRRQADDWDLSKRFPEGPKPIGETKFLKAWREAGGDFTKIPSLPGAPDNRFPALSREIRRQFGWDDPDEPPQADQDDHGVVQHIQRAPDPEGPPAHQASPPDDHAKGPPGDPDAKHPDLGEPDDEPA